VTNKSTLKFNLNDTIRVRLTERGKKSIRDFAKMSERTTRMLYPKVDVEFPTYDVIEEDKEGYSEWVCWELFRMLGPYLSACCHKDIDVFEDVNIEIIKDK